MAALKAYDDATAVHDELRRRTAAAGAAKDRLVRAMKPIYQAPAAAADALLAHGLAPGGLETAKAILRTSPESLGALRPDERRGWEALKPWDTFKNAKLAASQLDWPLENAVWTMRSAPEPEQLRRAAMEVEQRLVAVDAAREARTAVSELSDRALMQRAALSLEPLRRFMNGDELELRLGRVLNATALKLLPKVIAVLIKLAEGPQRGHGHELGL